MLGNHVGGARLRALDPDVRCDGDECAALVGKLGQRVHCTIYDYRPRGCRRVEAGSDRCLIARRERGISS